MDSSPKLQLFKDESPHGLELKGLEAPLGTQPSFAEPVLVVSIDGVTPRSITPTTMPNLCGLARTGAGCFRARTVEPPLTLPAHASMLRGVEPRVHGVVTNEARKPADTGRTFLKAARDGARSTAVFISWRPFESILESDAASMTFVLDSGYEQSDDRTLVDVVTAQPGGADLTFVYLSEPDLVAHMRGWDSESYIDSLGRADSLLSRLVDHAGSDTAVLVTTDHGGVGFEHHDPVDATMETFVVIRSSRIQPGSIVPVASVLDIAPTVADLLEVARPDEWTGRSLIGLEQPLIAHLLSLLQTMDEHSYGERVSMLDHSLQTAANAIREAPGDDALALAALMHDIGHLLGDAGEHGLADHAPAGARFLQQWFSAEVVEPIRLHVAAKRWLVHDDPGYRDQLSAASLATLREQGGPFDPAESEAFLSEPHSAAALALRRWDDAGKQAGAATDELESFRPLLERALREGPRQLSAEWARDSCRCDECRDPQTGQHLIDVADLAGWQIDDVSGDGDLTVVTVVSDQGEVHRCLIPAPAPLELDTRRTWGAELDVPLHAYHGLDHVSLARDIHRLGIAIVGGLPREQGEVLRFARSLGFVRETNYGNLFDVVDRTDANNLAYTSLGLPLHTDNPYREPVPTVQLLHCINDSVTGGVSRFSDGFGAAELLRMESPEDFRAITDTPVTFRFVDGASAVDLRATRPLIELSPSGRVLAVNVNHRSMEAPSPGSATPRFYTAYRTFRDLIDAPTSVVERSLQPGELVVFDNRRVLHGRSSFRTGGGRHLQGCYVDIDAIRSLARTRPAT